MFDNDDTDISYSFSSMCSIPNKSLNCLPWFNMFDLEVNINRFLGSLLTLFIKFKICES